MYNLLNGLKALEVTVYWPDAVGQYLADLGAEVIRVEPPAGAASRLSSKDPGVPLSHMHHNRSKQSISLDLKTPDGRDIFLEMARAAHFIIDGARAGAMDGFGLGYDAVKQVKPDIIYVSISGWGQSGPYRRLATHGWGFDSWSGLRPPNYRPDGLPSMPPNLPELSCLVGCQDAVIGALAAHARRLVTGEGAHIDVSEAEAGATYLALRINRLLNPLVDGEAPASEIDAPGATRLQYYPTQDEKVIVFMPLELKFWNKFCELVNRPDLSMRGDGGPHLYWGGDEGERRELAAIFRTKTRDEWIQLFIEHNLPGGPVNTPAELLNDPQFQGRDCVVDYADPERGTLKMLSTAIKVKGQKFEVDHAPELGEHTDQILSSLGYSPDRIQKLRAEHVI